MSTVKEQDIQAEIMNYIRSRGGIAIKQNEIGIYSEAGVPDIIVCYKGLFVAVETKRPKKKPTVIQQKYIDDINKNGGAATKLVSIEGAKKFLDWVDYQFMDVLYELEHCYKGGFNE
jgi:Holliday junction resolvase